MKKPKAFRFATEADLVATFCDRLAKDRRQRWKVYHETGGFDLLLVDAPTGVQVGLEAKLAFNNKVLVQALPSYAWDMDGPDYRGVLVPLRGYQVDLGPIASRLGLGVVSIGEHRSYLDLPDPEHHWESDQWHPWVPRQRVTLPDYVPDVVGGKPAPVKLTDWKVRAIKVLILLERQGYITRSDLRHIGISPSRWTQPGGFLSPRWGGFVRWERTPDFRKDHPTNSAEIEADFETWKPPGAPRPPLPETMTAPIQARSIL